MSRLVRAMIPRALILFAGALLATAGWLAPAHAVQIEQVTSNSGIGAWLVEDHSIPVVTLRFAFPGGAALDPAGKGGVASIVSALLDEGAGPYDTNAFHARLDDLAGQLRFDAGQDEFSGSLRMLKRNLTDTADLLRVALTDAHFTPEAIDRVRGEVLAILARQARSPRSLAGRLWMRDAFETHPYGSNTHGTEKSLATITREDLQAFVGQRFQRKGLIVAIVGDVTPAEAGALVDRVFGLLPIGDPGSDLPEVKPGDNGALVVNRWPVPQSVVTFGQVGVKRADPDWYTALVLNDILGGGNFRGRLMLEIREKRGLAYGVSTDLVSYRHAGLILGNVATENARVGESIALIRSEWKRMREEGPTETELQKAKTYLTGSFPLSLDSTQHIAAVLVQMQVDRLGIDYLDRRAGLIGAVTLDKAKDLARRLYDPDRLSFVVVGDPADVTPTREPHPAQQ
jgi:zinc protease